MMKIFKNVFSKKAVAFMLCLIIASVFVLGACNEAENGGTTTGASTNTTVNTMNFVYPEGVKVGGVDVSGMAVDAAFQAVEAKASALLKEFTLTVKAGDKEFTYGKENFTWDYNIDDALTESVNYCQKNDLTKAKAEDLTFELKPAPEADSVNTLVNDIAKAVDVAAVEATLSLEDGEIKVSKEKAGLAVDKTDLSKKITEQASALVIGNGKEATVEATIKEVAPQNKFDTLNGELQLIATYSTESTNTPNGNHNMQLSMAACDGSVIYPGDVWSFNECTGDSNLTSLGYLPATVIAGGEFVDGIGGGICQASSTIYNAAILANMEIYQRHYHLYQSSYVPAGRDATIDYPGLDLKLVNPTDYPMYMQCYMEGTTLTVNIYGWDDPSFDYIDIETSVHSGTDEGYAASAWRVYYLNDKEVGREELPESWYEYPDNNDDDDEDETTKATKPKETKPKATKPQETKPKETEPKATTPKTTVPKTTQSEVVTVPQTTAPATIPSDPEEPVTTKPPVVTDSPSINDEQIQTATANY